MKKLLLGTVGLAALAVPALAADMGVVRRPVAYVAATNWTGCYVGGDVGDSWGTHDGYSATGATTQVTSGVPVPAGTPISGSFNTSGFTGGFYGGCNYQVGVWVFGVEGEWSNVNNEGQSFEFTPPRPLGTLWVDSAKERWFVTARGRLGYAVDKWLLYATGGAAWTKIDGSEFLLTNAATATLQSDHRTGWTVGAGVEYALPYGWLIRSEYLYMQFDSYNTFTSGPFGTAAFSNQSTGKLTNNIWRAGLAYKFDFYGKGIPTVVK